MSSITRSLGAKARVPVALGEAAAIYTGFYLYRTLLQHLARGRPDSPFWHVILALWLSAFVVFLSFWIRGRRVVRLPLAGDKGLWPSREELLRGVGLGILLCTSGLVSAFLGASAGWSNPLWLSLVPSARPWGALLPTMALSSLAVGVSEELLFRIYLPAMFRNSGLRNPQAGMCSTMLFALAHAGQGAPGILSMLVLGGILQRFADRGERFRSLVIGHALYDFAILWVALSV